MLSEQDEGAEGFHASTLTSAWRDGKHSEKIERNAQKKRLCEILWLICKSVFGIFALYFSMAQLGGIIVVCADLFAGKPAHRVL